MNRKILLTKKCIKESLFELLETTEINKISIKSLCENADINHRHSISTMEVNMTY